MAQFSLSSHRFTVLEGGRKKDKNENPEILDSIGKEKRVNPIDLFAILSDELNGYNNTDEKSQKKYNFQVNCLDNEKRMISGIVNSGDFGYEAILVNVDDEKQVKKRGVRDAELIPYYYLIYLPKNSEYGYLILERFQKSGIQTIFINSLESIIKGEINNEELQYKIDTGNCFNKSLFLDILKDSDIKEITAIRTFSHPAPAEMSDDKADKLSKSKREKKVTKDIVDYHKKTSLQPVGKQGPVAAFVKRLQQIVLGDKIIGNDLLKEFGVSDYDELTIRVRHNNMDRSIKLYDKDIKLDYNNQLFPYIDITKKVQKSVGGHPIFESIDMVAKEHLSFLLNNDNKQVVVHYEDEYCE